MKSAVKICNFGILMDFSVLRYQEKMTPQEDQTVECAEFSVKIRWHNRCHPSELFENVFVQAV